MSNTNGVQPENNTSTTQVQQTDNGIEDILAAVSSGEKVFLWSISKIVDTGNGGKREEIQTQSEGETPSLHEIGSIYGGGSYKFKYWEQGKSREKKSTTFHLGSHYDIVSMEYWEKKKNPSFSPSVPAPVTVPAPVDNSFQMLKEVIALLVPLMQPQQQSDPTEAMLKHYTQMDMVLKKQSMNNVQFYNNMQLRLTGQPTEGNETMIQEVHQQEQNDLGSQLIETVLPMLDQFLPMLLNKVSGGAAANMVKKSDEYQALIEDETALQKVVGHLVEEKGIDVTKQVLQRLDIPFEIAE